MGSCGCGANNNFFYANKKPNPIECNYDLNYYQELLVKVNNQLSGHSQYGDFKGIVQSQINSYTKNCALFEEYIQMNIAPLIT